MSRLLVNTDYLRAIQEDSIQQIIEENEQIRLDVEQSAQSEMISYLSQRYKTNEVFTNTTEFSNSAVYYAKNLVYYTAPAFSASTVYTTDQRVSYLGNIYNSNSGSAAHAFNSSEWTLVCKDGDFFYVTLPSDEFDLETTYAIGDIVWYEDKEYTCAVACVGIVPGASGSTPFWGTGTTYSITAILPDDDTKWTLGDNRNQLIVQHLLNITLYWLHLRINPRNVPDHRKIAYDGNGDIKNAGSALNWLKSVAGGDINADLPEVQPQQGLSIRFFNANDSDTLSNNFLW